MAVDEEAAAALRRVGVKEADIEAALAQEADEQEAQEPDEEFEVHEDNWQSLLFFLRVQTQWVYFGIGGEPSRIEQHGSGVHHADGESEAS